jgi:integrase
LFYVARSSIIVGTLAAPGLCRAVCRGRFVRRWYDVNDQLVRYFRRQGELTLEELLGFVFRHHLNNKPSGLTWKSNARWWCQTTGAVKIHRMTELDTNRHVNMRKAGHVGRCKAGDQSRKHDIKLLVLALSLARSWKQKRRTLDGFRFGRCRLPEFSPTDPKDVPRPRPSPRQHDITVMDFARFFERSHEDLQDRLSFLIDSGQSPCDVKRWRVVDYDRAIDGIRFRRSKGKKDQVFPVTSRCRRIIEKAVAEKRVYILKWQKEDEAEHRRQVDNARWASKVYFQPGRDLRKKLINEILEAAGGDIRPAQKAAGHSSPETTWKHYIYDKGIDLRGYHQAVSSKFGGGPAKVHVRLPGIEFFSN